MPVRNVTVELYDDLVGSGFVGDSKNYQHLQKLMADNDILPDGGSYGRNKAGMIEGQLYWYVGNAAYDELILSQYRLFFEKIQSLNIISTCSTRGAEITDFSENALNELRKQVDNVLSRGEYQVFAYMDGDGNWYCLDDFCYHALKNNANDIAELYLVLLRPDMPVTAFPKVAECITSMTVSFEAYPGQIIPKKGVRCCQCNNELYEPYQPDPDE